MTDFESLKQEIFQKGKGSALDQLAKSSEVQKVGKSIDKDILKKAAAEGDSETLNRILQQVMSTEDGKALFKKVSESFGGNS